MAMGWEYLGFSTDGGQRLNCSCCSPRGNRSARRMGEEPFSLQGLASCEGTFFSSTLFSSYLP